MLDHLTNDFRIYDQVCLNVRDIQELKLIQMPDFHQTKQKLRSIDPCLIDIKLSSEDQSDYLRNNDSINYNTVARLSPSQQTTSSWTNSHNFDDSQSINNQLLALLTNDSSDTEQTVGVADERNDDSIDEQLEKFNKLKETNLNLVSPTSRTDSSITLIAKKVLSKKIEKRPEPVHSSSDTNTFTGRMLPLKYLFPDSKESVYGNLKTVSKSVNNTIKKTPITERRKSSPIRVTITSTLNPNAPPFIATKNPNRTRKSTINGISSQNPNYPSFTFYEKRRFRPRFQQGHSMESIPYNTSPNSRVMPFPRQILKQTSDQHVSNVSLPHSQQQVISPSQSINRTRHNSATDRRYSNNNKPNIFQQHGGYLHPSQKKKAYSYDSMPSPPQQQQG
ncbi:unnamed protein product [Didymodactylos carnosus]|uniref:Uncharacterized protein n=1 Tax=Didymodactylos carnosus TaxID=1234261 RepID=A0A8S2RWU5_9BILA|nr:unnamed protein product [Didymodactylos carnosus]CAF4184573.1 unnamed protein product [Didymodactylos carnosus]